MDHKGECDDQTILKVDFSSEKSVALTKYTIFVATVTVWSDFICQRCSREISIEKKTSRFFHATVYSSETYTADDSFKCQQSGS